MQRPKMAGNWKPVPDEVYEKLDLCHHSCDHVYLCLRFAFHVEEDYSSPGEWVTGKVRATKVEIIGKSQVTENLFYRRLWPDLKKVGLVEDGADGWVILPYVWRKLDVSISAAEVREMEQSQEESDNRIEDLERRLQDMEQRLREMKSGHSIDQEPRLAEEDLDSPPAETGSVAESTATIAESTATIAVSSFKEERSQEEEEEGRVSKMEYPGAENEPGSRGWITSQIDQLWPGRGWKESDQGYIEELEKFSTAELEAAFKRARADNAKYGNYDYLLNYLRNPGLYNRRRRKSGSKGKKKKGSRASVEGNEDIGGLKADWLDDDSNTEEGEQ